MPCCTRWIAFARDPHGTVAGVPISVYYAVLGELATPAAAVKIRKHVLEVYKARVKALGWKNKEGEPPSDRISARACCRSSALDVGDPALLAQGAALGEKILGSTARRIRRRPIRTSLASPSRAPSQGRRPRIRRRPRAARREHRRAGAQPLLHRDGRDARRGPRPPRPRSLARSAPAQQRAHRRAARAGRRSRDPRPHVAVAPGPLRRSGEALPDRFAGYIPGSLHLCDDATAAELGAFFGSRAEHFTGMRRNLALALEAGKQCVARAAAQRAAVTTFANRY